MDGKISSLKGRLEEAYYRKDNMVLTAYTPSL
jgi:hypothetical protein